MSGSEKLDGSSQDTGGIQGGKMRVNTFLTGTANNLSTSKEISKAAGPVPLYLVPQALSKEIHEFGDAIIEVHIRRTRGHNYLLELTAAAKEESDNDS